jgi:hypothetical protein
MVVAMVMVMVTVPVMVAAIRESLLLKIMDMKRILNRERDLDTVMVQEMDVMEEKDLVMVTVSLSKAKVCLCFKS